MLFFNYIYYHIGDDEYMTRQQLLPKTEDPYSAWIRHQPELDAFNFKIRATDVDMVIWSAITGYMIFIETKTNSAPTKPFQYCLMRLLDQALSTADNKEMTNILKQYAFSCTGSYEYRGYYQLLYQNNCFNDGTASVQRIYADGEISAAYQLHSEKELLSFTKYCLAM